MKKFIILDYDGTIHNTMKIYRKAFLETYEWLVREDKAGRREFEDSQISRWLGFNSKEMWNTFMPDLEEEYKAEASRRIGASMVEQVKHGEAALYPGAEQALQELKDDGNHLIFLSNCKEQYRDIHRHYFKLDRFFDDFYCCETYGFIPKGEIIPHILVEHPGDYLSIGDRRSDYEASRENNIPFIACLYGFGSREEYEHTDAFADDVSRLPELARSLRTVKNS
ncbi:MAG: HAD family hydrolase [Ruminococcus sp.]|jgi:phosphoglycolate phosphatase